MLKQILKSLYRRDLEKLKLEIDSYKDESKIWSVEKDVTNSAGNLTLHLIGNLNAFIGAEIGKTYYVRQRELEFSSKNIAKNELVQMIDDTLTVVENALDSMADEQFNEEYPLIVFTEKMMNGYFLTHLATHLAYHLGQINYHRRLLDAQEN